MLDKNMDAIKRLDESQSKASSGPTRQTEGSFGYQVSLGMSFALKQSLFCGS